MSTNKDCCHCSKKDMLILPGYNDTSGTVQQGFREGGLKKNALRKFFSLAGRGACLWISIQNDRQLQM